MKEVWVGVGGSSPCEKNTVWAVLNSCLFMTHSCWQPLFTSHILYLRRRGSAAYPPLSGSRVCERSVGGWEGAIIPSLGIMCTLGGFNSLAVEAECLNVASRPLFTLSFNYLCPPPTPHFWEQSSFNEIITILEDSKSETLQAFSAYSMWFSSQWQLLV